MATHVILTGTGGALEGQEFTFAGQEEVVIGRSVLCSLRLDDPTVSRQHCQLDVAGQWAWVRDLGSLNGTFVNGQDVGRHLWDADKDEPVVGGYKLLREGDELRLGAQAFRVGVTVTDPSVEQASGESELCTVAA
jgi:pSer/pThr/pTyr-binding forkhead associated (FHA) protein